MRAPTILEAVVLVALATIGLVGVVFVQGEEMLERTRLLFGLLAVAMGAIVTSLRTRRNSA